MKIPFTVDQFMEVFRQYNLQLFPIQIVLLLLACVAIVTAVRKISVAGGRVISVILAFLWGWMGIVYHWGYFTSINKAAYIFAVAFVVQSLLFLYTGVYKQRLDFGFQKNIQGWTGAALITYALLVYPALGYVQGHVYPAAPTFGLPCPTTIFTLGMLLWSVSKPPFYLLLIPLLWSLIGTMAAFNLGIREDLGLPAAALIAGWLIWRR